MFEGKAPKVGVAGRTLTELCGELMWCWLEDLPTDEWCKAEELMEFDVEEVDEALECAGGRCMERIDETDDDVDFRPRRPEPRR